MFKNLALFSGLALFSKAWACFGCVQQAQLHGNSVLPCPLKAFWNFAVYTKREKASYLPKSHPHSDVKKISHHVHTFHSVFSLTSSWASSLVKNAQTTLAWKFLWRILDLLRLWEISNTHPWNTVLESARCLSTLLRFFWQPLRRKTSIQYKKKERLYLIKWLLPRDVTFHEPHFFLLHVICSKLGLLK